MSEFEKNELILPCWKQGRIWFYLFLSAFFLILCLTYLLRPIFEPDFFWHLKTGEWIWQHGTLPSIDPFGFAWPENPDTRQLFILKGYWLVQVFYHLVQSLFGIAGVYLIRVVTLAAFLLLFITIFESQQINRWLSFSVIAAFLIFYLENYALERPQVVSFLGILLLMNNYRWFKDGRSGRTKFIRGIFVFVLMLFWANMHGGVLLGQGAIIIVILVEFCLYLKQRDRDRFLNVLSFAVAGLVGAVLTPIHLGVVDILGAVGLGASSFGGTASVSNYEYYSLLTWLLEEKRTILLFPVGLSVASLMLIPNAFRQKAFAEILLLIIFWVYAFKFVRYLPIAMVYSLLFVAWNYHAVKWHKAVVAISIASCLFMFCKWSVDEFGHFGQTRRIGFVHPLMFPVKAADYLRSSGYRGRIFNTYNWGSYLLWRLGPDIKVAADSRLLNIPVNDAMRNVSLDPFREKAGKPFWKGVMDQYDIDVAVVPLMNGLQPSSLPPLFEFDREWTLVFKDQISAIYARN